ncbi:unnamed protein product [Spirodela intermedia]|uniref:Lunapark zinc ribbon domain-containing protein n=1 Tax=Spirodela intermedia TaxID=51605 RepID=A0A7I8LN21_SPIIN|nr:unnamed protein product [Spirodela intermedia]
MSEEARGGGDAAGPSGGKNPSSSSAPRKGFLSRMWNAIFRRRGDDYEKKLQYLSKEEASVHARMKKRAHRWRTTARNIVLFSVAFEVAAIAYAVIKTRPPGLSWQMRATCVLPIFALPALSFALYSILGSLTRMLDRKDQKTLERLRIERQAKIDELKERTNFYATQELIQRYDLDPAAKAAAATVLASKLGADTGLKVYVEDDSKDKASQRGGHRDHKAVQSDGLRNRKRPHTRSQSQGGGGTVEQSTGETSPAAAAAAGGGDAPTPPPGQRVVEHYRSTIGDNDGGWLARIAAMLVGEDPAQSYALICGNCRRHNGLARKEDFPYITYFCPHCHALNRPRQAEEQEPGDLVSADDGVARSAGSGTSIIKGEPPAGEEEKPASGAGGSGESGEQDK